MSTQMPLVFEKLMDDDRMFDHPAVLDALLKPLTRFDPAKPLDPVHRPLETNFLEQYRSRALSLIARHRNTSVIVLPPIHFDYVDSNDLQAYACFLTRFNRCGYISYFTGMVYLIYDLFYRVMSHPRLLADVGDATAEIIREPAHSQGFSVYYDELLTERGSTSNGLADVVPKDPRRKRHAEMLAEIALDFMTLHEVCHIRNGHCSYSQSKHIPFLMEAKSGSVATLDPMTHQALEMDADCYAATATFRMRILETTEADRTNRSLLVTGPEIVSPYELMMFDWVFATSLMFWMFGQLIDPNDLAAALHPPPPMRSTMAPATAHEFVRKKLPQHAASLDSSMRRGTAHVVTAVYELYGQKLPAEFATFVTTLDSGLQSSHSQAILDRWSQIRDELLRYSYNDLAL